MQNTTQIMILSHHPSRISSPKQEISHDHKKMAKTEITTSNMEEDIQEEGMMEILGLFLK